jgi:hypothetical protein
MLDVVADDLPMAEPSQADRDDPSDDLTGRGTDAPTFLEQYHWQLPVHHLPFNGKRLQLVQGVCQASMMLAPASSLQADAG